MNAIATKTCGDTRICQRVVSDIELKKNKKVKHRYPMQLNLNLGANLPTRVSLCVSKNSSNPRVGCAIDRLNTKGVLRSNRSIRAEAISMFYTTARRCWSDAFNKVTRTRKLNRYPRIYNANRAVLVMRSELVHAIAVMPQRRVLTTQIRERPQRD